MTDEVKSVTGEVIEKSQVTIAPPGYPARFSFLGGSQQSTVMTHASKREQYGIYYEMFRQHPIVRGAIEKISKYSVSTGFHFEPEDPNDELDETKAKALRQFFRRSNAIHLLRLTYKDLLIYGEAFWYIDKAILGNPIKALRLHPKYMAPRLNAAETEIVEWEYGPGPNDNPKRYKNERVLHFRFDDPESDTNGLSLLHSLQLTVATDLNAMHFNGNFFENSAQTGLIIIVKTSTGDEAKRNREWLDQNYVGTRNAHRPLLLEGDVDVKPSVNRMTDMQYVEGRVLSRQEIMTTLDVPPEKLNIVEDFRRPQQGGDASDPFQSETISPIQSLVEEEINNKLVLEIFGWEDILFRHNESNNQSELNQAKLYKEYEVMGVMSVNQIAAKLGLPKVKGGDGHFVQTAAGMIPVDILDEVAARLVQNGQKLPDPISGVGTDTFGNRNPKQQGQQADTGASN